MNRTAQHFSGLVAAGNWRALGRFAPSWGMLQLAAILFITYLVLYRTSNIFHTTDLRATPWNPEAGLAVAAGFLLGWRAVVLIVIASFIGTSLWGFSVSVYWTFAIAVTHALAFAGSATFFRAHMPDRMQASIRTIALFFAFAAVATALSALARLLIATVALGISVEYLWSYTLAISIGNFVGVVTAAPIFLVFATTHSAGDYFGQWTRFHVLATLAAMALAYVVFGLRDTDEFKFFYLVFLPVIAFAARDGLRGAVFAVLFTDIAMTSILYWRDFEASTALELQVLMISLAATGLILGAAVSEQKRFSVALAESHVRLQESQAALLQASRLSLVSEMAAALAHELNQPLSAIRNFVRSARRRLDRPRFDRQAVTRDIDGAVSQVDAAAELIRRTRRFLERGEAARGRLALDGLVRNAIALVEPELRSSHVVIKLHEEENLPAVLGNEAQLQQVFLNLVRNAKEAIVAGNSTNRHIQVLMSGTRRAGFVEVSVVDRGSGVDPDIRGALFTPLRSSKPEGLGLGLSLCRTIIGSHGGEIWYDDSARGETRFVFTVPVAETGNG